MSNIQNKIVRVKEILSKEGGKYSLVADNGDRFSFKQNKTDGSKTQQYIQAFEEKGVLQAGQVIKVGYTDEEFNGRAYKKLVSVYPYTPKPGEVVSFGSGENSAPGPTKSTTRAVNDSLIVRQVAFKGAIEVITAGQAPISDAKQLTDTFQGIIEGKPEPESHTEQLPVIQQETPVEDINVEDIPF